MSNREQELEDSLASLRPWELEDRIRQLEAEVRRLTDEKADIQKSYDKLYWGLPDDPSYRCEVRQKPVTSG